MATPLYVDCKIEENSANCPCTYLPAGKAGPGCDKKGKCCDCLSYHLGRNELPACCFPPEIEKTYNRSINKFIEVNKAS